MYKSINDLVIDTKSLQIQGASSVAKIVVDILTNNKDNLQKKSKNKDEFIDNIKDIAARLALAEPTETMAQNILGSLIVELQDDGNSSLEACVALFEKTLGDITKKISANEKTFVENGVQLVRSLSKKSRVMNILTHCHSSGVRNVLRAANEAEIPLKVFNTETRPVFLGRATAKKMVDENMDVTMIIDSAAPFIISGKGGDKFKTDAVLLGCDALTINGDAVNKIGSYGISLSAFFNKIPLYIVTSLLKTRRGVYNILDIPMEIRPCSEVWAEAPSGLNIVNLGFDIIPNEFITGYITEFGVIKPDDIKNVISKNYPRLL